MLFLKITKLKKVKMKNQYKYKSTLLNNNNNNIKFYFSILSLKSEYQNLKSHNQHPAKEFDSSIL